MSTFDLEETQAKELLEQYDWIVRSTPVIEVASSIGNLPLKLEGINPLEYLNICRVESNSFNHGNAINTLSSLSRVHDGIVLSKYLCDLLNRSVGDRISLFVGGDDNPSIANFRIIGLMESAPGFGYSAEVEADSTSLPWQLGLPGINFWKVEIRMLLYLII